MSGDKGHGKSDDRIGQNGENLKRRDLLLSGTSLAAASALSGSGLTTSAQTDSDAAKRETAKHRLHHG
jgi:arylsulfatase